MPRSLIVLPDDSSRPILDAIAAAKKSLRIKMFVFSDPSLIAAVIAAQQRGVEVRVMLNPARRSGEAENQESRAELTKGKVSVEDSNPAFDLTHEKSMVVDDVGLRQSLNRDPENLTETRDWRRSPTTPPKPRSHRMPSRLVAQVLRTGRRHLIWCNNNGRSASRTSSTRRSTIFAQNERSGPGDPRTPGARRERGRARHGAAAARSSATLLSAAGRASPRRRYQTQTSTSVTKMLLADESRSSARSTLPGSCDAAASSASRCAKHVVQRLTRSRATIGRI
jgi:hypothetical protein